ncbi:MAG: hypothetical protein GF417_09180 [Candidatus Latescibacteria bacterium]|nr:hypothetical protein [Candidatus Latescibacterota bacterium]
MKKALIIFKNNSIFFRRQGVWGFLALVFSLLTEIPIILAGLVMISEINEVKDVTMGIALVILLIFGFKIMLQGMGQANELNINLKTLVPFPISSNVKFMYLLSLRSFSISSIYFITFFAILTYGLMRKEVFAGIYAGALFLLFILMIDICMTDVIMFFGRIFKKHKVIPMLLFYLFFAPVLLSSAKIIPGDQLFDYINRVPVLNWPGNGVFAAMTGQWLNAGLNILYIVAFSIAGYLLGIFMIKKKYYI